MSFIDVRFPEEYAYGALATDDWQLEIVETLNRHEHRNAPIAHPRRSWDLSTTGKTIAQKDGIRDFFMATMGGLHSFAFRDLADYQLTQGQIFVGDGSTDQVQLVKPYTIGNETVGTLTYERPITLPVVDTVRVWVNDVETSAWDVGRDDGILIFESAPAEGAIVTASCDFDVPVRFRESRLSWSARDRIGDDGLLFFCDALALIEVINDIDSGSGLPIL